MNNKLRKCCIILSGGIGTRMGSSSPKQYIEIHGRTIFEYSLQRVLSWKDMDSVIVVADPAYHSQIEFIIKQYISSYSIQFLGFAMPGDNRQGSIINALEGISEYMAKGSVVMIHDAVRPLVSAELIAECDNKLKGSDGVMPYLEMKDTVYENKKVGKQLFISSNIDRDTLVAGQTPEFFKFHKYLECCKSLTKKELKLIHGSTEPAVLGGMKIALVKGDEKNFKITTPEDLERFKEIVEKEKLYKKFETDVKGSKKTILYCINAASIIFYEDKMIDKIRRNFKVFEENADGVVLLWTMDQHYSEKMEIASASLRRKLKNLFEKNRFSPMGRYIDYDDAKLELDNIDAYYGDWNYFAWKCQQLGKPVMIQNIEV